MKSLESQLELTNNYAAALTLAHAVKKKLIECDAPHQKAIFKVIDDELERLYGEEYEQQRAVSEAERLIKGV